MQYRNVDWDMTSAAAFDAALVALAQVETVLRARAVYDRRLSCQAKRNLAYLRGRVGRTRRMMIALAVVVLTERY